MFKTVAEAKAAIAADRATLLTDANAIAYVRKHFASFEEPSPLFNVRAVPCECDLGVDAIDVHFVMDGRAEYMTVWVEGNKLYGEW